VVKIACCAKKRGKGGKKFPWKKRRNPNPITLGQDKGKKIGLRGKVTGKAMHKQKKKPRGEKNFLGKLGKKGDTKP